MKSKEIRVNDETITVEVGDTFTVRTKLHFGSLSPIEPGTEMTVEKITRNPDGIHFEFTPDDQNRTETVYQFALENNLEQNHMAKN
jgi:hypothetical protein